MNRTIILFFSLIVTFLNAQTVRGIYGDFSDLLTENDITIQFNYDSMIVVGYGSEENLIKTMKEKMERKEQGWGAKWEKAWKENKTATFERRFRTLFCKYAEIDSSASARYILMFKTRRLDPGFESVSHFAYIDGEAWLVKKSQPDKIIAKVAVSNVKGEAFVAEYSGNARIGDAYAIAGRLVGKYVKKNK